MGREQLGSATPLDVLGRRWCVGWRASATLLRPCDWLPAQARYCMRMSSWTLRGVFMGALVTVAWILVGVLMRVAATIGTTWSTIALALIVLAAIVWGGYDGIRDARANPDPDDYADLTMVWLKAGFLSAVIAVIIGWIAGMTLVPRCAPWAVRRPHRGYLVPDPARVRARLHRCEHRSLAGAPRGAQGP